MEKFFEMFAPILFMIGIVVIIVAAVKINKAIKHSHSVCPKCKKEYSYPENFAITAGALKWERKTRKETKGDFEYEMEYKQYYRYLKIDLKCGSCGHEHSIIKRVNVWRSDSTYSQSDAEELETIKDFVRKQFDKSMFEGKEIEIFVCNS